ncbi:hypothetical protein LWC34_17705 [Kibdelosporangium philippinense]|uniref:Uncharacterized protein n=1 Tax=Kibdelosporangium philippinense TaxID=211113 RepID=A0ABS8ZDB0_9PSEU|nr:hypothetical protein [Kibdelosporangium philippinense]MCE7004646.1 hypothetical protein [Kibdelosporangium philippinense]
MHDSRSLLDPATAALLEQHQQADGSVSLADVLTRYLGYKVINADGTTSH